jgi:hypothetical protein
MRWQARMLVAMPRSEGEWERWFAWYPVAVRIEKDSACWVWLEVLERKWSTVRDGKRRYRLPEDSSADLLLPVHVPRARGGYATLRNTNPPGRDGSQTCAPMDQR